MASNADKMGEVIDRLTSLVETSGALPWARPWVSSEVGTPISAVTGKPYQGINHWLLGLTGQVLAPSEPNVWATYKQIKAEGGQVRKGEKSTTAVLWKPVKKDESGEEKSFLLLRTFNVFHWTQADWETEPKEVRKARARATARPAAAEAHEAAEAVVQTYLTNGPTLAEGGDRAFYSPLTDHVQVPEADQFVSTDGRYRTLFHELGHSTGHKSRLDRTFGEAFGNERYSREELVAELTSAILCDHVGIDSQGDGGHDGTDGERQSAAYIKGWLRGLKDDPMALSYAASRAAKAAAVILGEVEVEKEEAA